MVNAYACNRIQPNLETLQQIAEILQVDLKDLITDKRIGDMKQFSEATRVQMPAMVHLTRIGYTYFGKLSEDKMAQSMTVTQIFFCRYLNGSLRI